MIEQIYARHRYWNRLVEIEKGYQNTCQQVIDQVVEQLGSFVQARDDALAALESAKESVKTYRQTTRGRKTPAELTERVKDARLVYQQARDGLKQARKNVLGAADVKDQLEQARKDRTEAVRVSRHEYGLYWGNYLDVEFYYKQARQKKGKFLKLHRVNSEGSVSVWFQRGLAVSDIGVDSRLLIEKVHPAVYEQSRAIRRKQTVTTFGLRVGSDENKRPVYLRGVMVMHRPLADGLIRHASVKRERVGRFYRYKLLVTVQLPDEHHHTHLEDRPVVGVDLGWRLFPDRLRVAYVTSQDGSYLEDLSLGPDLLERFETLKNLASIRKNWFNYVKKVIAEEVKAPDAPDWLKEAAGTVDQWRSPSRMVRLLRQWDDTGPAQGQLPELYSTLKEAVKKDRHLWDWEANLRDKLLRRRRETYRIFAKRLASMAGNIVIEEFNLNNVIGGEDALHQAEYYRVIASVSSLRLALKAAAEKAGVPVVVVDAANTTQECNLCGKVVGFNAQVDIIAICTNCGGVWDQDLNAARVLAARGA